jgi:hypothetical protein
MVHINYKANGLAWAGITKATAMREECENGEVRLSFVGGRRWRAPRYEFKASNPEGKECLCGRPLACVGLEKLTWMDWSSEEEEEEEEEEDEEEE